MSYAVMDWWDDAHDARTQEMLIGVFSAWADGKTPKMKTASGWKDITPDNMMVKMTNGPWVSVRYAIAAYDNRERAIEDTLGDAPEWTL